MYLWSPGNGLSFVLGVEPSKRRPFRIKTKGHLVPRIYAVHIIISYLYLPLPLVFLLIGGSPIDATPSPPPKTTYIKILAQKLRSECLPTLEEMITLQGYFAIPDQPVQETFPWMFVSRQDGQHPSTLWTTNFPKPRIWFICYGGHWDFPCGKKMHGEERHGRCPYEFRTTLKQQPSTGIGVRLNQTVTVWGI